jgi:pilus assembly protein Flp/PilA
MLQLITFFQSRLVRDERGATAVEYGLLVALIAAVIIAAVVLLGSKINSAFGTINSSL